MVIYYLSFCLTGKVLFSPSFLKDRFSGQGVLGWRFLAFRTLNISLHSILAYEVSVEKSDHCKGVSL